MRETVVLGLVMAVAGACGGRAVEPAAPAGVEYTAAVGDTVTLRVGDEVVVTGAGVRLGLEGVFDDSRCPVDVNCVWAGDAAVRLVQRPAAGAPTLMELHSHTEPRAVRVNGVHVRLVEIKPAPHSQRQIQTKDYAVRLAFTSD